MKKVMTTIAESEFICFVLYRICKSKSDSTDLIPNSTVILDNITCPAGTQSWYPQLVRSVFQLLSNSRLSLSTILMSLMYIARIKRSTPNFNLNGSEFSFFITALMIAQKMNNDAYYSIKWWSKCTNFSIHTLIQMEKKFMQLSGYSMHITVDDYQIWVRAVRFLAKDHLTMKNQRPSNGQICQPPKRIKTSHPLKRSSSIKISCNDVLPMTLEGIHT